MTDDKPITSFEEAMQRDVILHRGLKCGLSLEEIIVQFCEARRLETNRQVQRAVLPHMLLLSEAAFQGNAGGKLDSMDESEKLVLLAKLNEKFGIKSLKEIGDR